MQSGHSRLATHFWAAKGTQATKRKHHSDVSWRVSFIITTLIFIFISPRFQPQTEPSSYRGQELSRRASGLFSMQHLSGGISGMSAQRATATLHYSSLMLSSTGTPSTQHRDPQGPRVLGSHLVECLPSSQGSLEVQEMAITKMTLWWCATRSPPFIYY